MRRRGEDVTWAHLRKDRSRRHTWEGSLEANVLQLRDRAGQAEPDHAHAQAAQPVPAGVIRSTPHPLKVLRHRVTPGHTAAYDRAVSRGDMRRDGCHSSPPISSARPRHDSQRLSTSWGASTARKFAAKQSPDAIYHPGSQGGAGDTAPGSAKPQGPCRPLPPPQIALTRVMASAARARPPRPPVAPWVPLEIHRTVHPTPRGPSALLAFPAGPL